MYKRIIIIVSSALFILLAMLAVVITDLYDRDYPKDIDVKYALTLNFSESDLSINEAFAILEELDHQLHLGLLKVMPDLMDGEDQQVFALLNDDSPANHFTSFNGDSGKVIGKQRLENSYPDGEYLITNKKAQLGEFEERLNSRGVKIGLDKASIFKSLQFIIWEKGFAAAVLAALALIVALALFSLTIRARLRALRVLGGSSTSQIQLEDITSFFSLLLIPAIVIAFVSSIYITIFHGFVFVGVFLKVLFSLQFVVIIISVIAVLIMSAFAWPSAIMLATRQPAVKSLRRATIIVQSLIFVFVIASATPAWTTYKQSAQIATEMAQWKKLSDQVAIVFATESGEMERMEQQIGGLVKSAESNDHVALSYTYTQKMRDMINFREYSALSLVNERWIDLVTEAAPESSVTMVSKDMIPGEVIQMIYEEIGILLRKENSEDLLKEFQFYRPIDGFKMPVAEGGSAQLHFFDDVLLVVVPSLYEVFNDSTLTSMISGSNISFTGVTNTDRLLKQKKLDVQSLRSNNYKGELRVVYIAEEGLLRAQYMAYVTWLQSLALIALIVAFTVATIIHALMTARIQARSDFPLRLAGKSWLSIVKGRIMIELLAGFALLAVVIIIQKPETVWIIFFVMLYGAFIVPLCHLFSVRRYFKDFSIRRI